MPVHTCSFDALEDTVAAIEATTERIINFSLAADDNVVVILTYLPKPGRPAKGIETR
jgi:hypothetical protein